MNPRIPALLVTTAAFTALGWAISGNNVASADPSPGPTKVVITADNMGASHFFEAALTVDSITGAVGKKVANIDVAFSSKTDDQVNAQYAVEVVDDLGNQIVAPKTFSGKSLAKRGDEVHDQIATPVGIGDGFYEVRLTAAARDASHGEASTTSLYLSVTNGVITELSISDWQKTSHAMMAKAVTP